MKLMNLKAQVKPITKTLKRKEWIKEPNLSNLGHKEEPLDKKPKSLRKVQNKDGLKILQAH